MRMSFLIHSQIFRWKLDLTIGHFKQLKSVFNEFKDHVNSKKSMDIRSLGSVYTAAVHLFAKKGDSQYAQILIDEYPFKNDRYSRDMERALISRFK